MMISSKEAAQLHNNFETLKGVFGSATWTYITNTDVYVGKLDFVTLNAVLDAGGWSVSFGTQNFEADSLLKALEAARDALVVAFKSHLEGLNDEA